MTLSPNGAGLRASECGLVSMLSAKQLSYASALFIVASSLLIKAVYVFSLQDSWLSVLVAILISLLVIGVYGMLGRRHPGMCPVKLSEAVFGRVVGKVVAAMYIFFFLSLAILNLEDAGSFVTVSILPRTPVTIVYVMVIVVCAMAVSKGHKMCMYSTMMVILVAFIFVLNMLLLFNKMELENFLPVLTQPPKNYFLAIFGLLMLPLCEIFVFMIFAPDMKKPEIIGSALKGGIFIGGFLLFIIVVRDIAALDGYLQYTNNPTFSSIRLIEIGDFLTRLEILYASILITTFTFKISVCFYAAIAGLARLFRIENYRIFIGIFGVLIVVATRGVFESTFEHNEWKRSAPIYSTLFLIILPIIMLLVSYLRFGKYPQKRQAASGGENAGTDGGNDDSADYNPNRAPGET